MRIATFLSYQRNGGHKMTYFVGAVLSKLKLLNATIFMLQFFKIVLTTVYGSHLWRIRILLWIKHIYTVRYSMK